MVDLLKQQGIQRVDLWQRGVDTETFHPDCALRVMRARLTEGHPEGQADCLDEGYRPRGELKLPR